MALKKSALKKVFTRLLLAVCVSLSFTVIMAEGTQDALAAPGPGASASPAAVTIAAAAPAQGPAEIKAAAEGVKVRLSWGKAGRDGLLFNVYRSVSPDRDFIRINKEDIKQPGFTDDRESSLIAPQSGTLYYYRVTSVDAGVESEDSKTVMATPYAPLAPPDQISLLPGFSSVKIKWVEPDESGSLDISGYNIYRSTRPGTYAVINTAPVTGYEYEDTGLTNGARYDYALQSVDAGGNTSALSSFYPAVPFSVISSPKNLTTTAVSSESIKLVWDAPDGGGTYGISGYNIYRSTQPGVFSGAPINERLAKGHKTDDNRTFYFDNMINSTSKPKPGSTYYYMVIPVDFQGNTGTPSAVITGAVPIIEVGQKGIISADISEYGLPPESRLTLSGSKSLTLKYAHTWWKHPISDPPESAPDIDQTLRLTLKGTIGRKINVDVNYDDTTLTDEYTKISISYAGEKDETLQEVSFGDLTLDLPATRYLSYAPQKLFGLRGKVKFGDKLTLTALAAQTKGINDTQVFTGSLRKKQTNSRDGVDLLDTTFLRNTYYYITKEQGVSIKPGSLKVYIDYSGDILPDINTELSTPGAKFRFKQLYSGVDYLVDYNEKIMKFNVGISNKYIIAVGYELVDGTKIGLLDNGSIDLAEANLISAANGETSPTAHLLQSGTQTSSQSDISHKVMSYYYMGETKINNPVTDTGGFKIEVTNSDGTQTYYVPQPWETNAADYYTIDTDFGILKFKSFFPFAEGQAQPLFPPYNGTTGNEKDAYNSTTEFSIYSKFKIHLEYNYLVSSYRLDNSPVVPGSERVTINGVLQKRDVHYYINNDAGEINFYKEKLESPITDSTEVKVTYEYLPFIGANSSNLFGGRLDYELLENLKLALTGLYKTSNPGTDTPEARSTETSLNTPYNSLVVDADLKFDLNRENLNKIINALPLVDGSDIPVDFKFTAETAYSDLNPNTYEKTFSGSRVEKGPAMIDNMESADIETSASLLKASWFPAAMPPFVTPENRAYITRDEATETANEPTSTDLTATNEKKVLKLNYSGLTNNQWDSFRQVLSASGMSLNQYNTLELSVRVQTNQPVKMSVDVGVISEDSNGNGTFAYNIQNGAKHDSEDADSNGVYITAEDTGIDRGIYAGGTDAYWGAGNGAMDTEDMNVNGRLDQEERYYHFDSEGSQAGTNITHPKLLLNNGDNWVKIKIPLKDFTNTIGNPEPNNIGINKDKYMSFIKHIRLNLKGSSSSPAAGTITIESIQFTGNSWNLQTPANETDLAGNPVVVDSSKMNIESISRDTDDTYVPNLDYYDWTLESDKKYETALKITHRLSNLDVSSNSGKPLYFATKTLSTSGGYDFHSYKYLKMDVYYDDKDPFAGNGRVMFIRIGSGSDVDLVPRYYQYNEQLDSIQTGGWRTVVFALDGSDGKRSSTPDEPNIRQAQYITLGFINPNSTQPEEVIYINNIRLTDAQSSTGRSSYLNSVLNYTGIGSLNHSYEDKESTFYTLADAGRADIKQHEISNNLTFNYTQLPFLPVSTNYFKNSRFLDGPNKDDPSYTRNGQVYDSYSEGYSNVVSFNLIPDLSLSNNTTVRTDIFDYSGINAHLDSVRKSMTFNPSFVWKAPANIFFIPLGSNTFDGRITYDNIETVYGSIDVSPTAQSIYYYNWRNDRKQDYKWTGAYNWFGLAVNPSYQYILSEQTGYLAAKYVFYQDSITDPHNKVDRYFVLRRDIMPRVSLSYPNAWIFSPSITYGHEYRMDYTQSYLDNHGRLQFSTAVNLSTLLNWLPDISSYSFSVESTQHYEEILNPGSLGKYDNMPFESRWNIFMWKMLNDEREIERFETAAKNGAFVISHTLGLSPIRIASIFEFAPSGSYSLNRTFYSQGAVRQFSENFTLSAESIYINNVTIPIPVLQDLVSGQRIAGRYSYMRNFTKDSGRMITMDDMTNSFSVSLPYSSKDSLMTGSLGLSGSRNDRTQGLLRSWTGTLTPTLSFNYKYQQTDPITFPSWLWFVGDKTFRLEQVLNLGAVLTVKYFMGGDNDKNINRTDVKEYSLLTTATYKFLQNLTATLSMEYGHKDDYWKRELEYDRFTISLGAVIEF